MTDPHVALVQHALHEHGCPTEEKLIAQLAAAGVELGSDPRDALMDLLDEIPDAFPLFDDRWVLLSRLFDGRVFTHRLSATEIEHDLLHLYPNLGAISLLTHDDGIVQFADGSPVEQVYKGHTDRLAERGLTPQDIPQAGSLLLAPGSLRATGVAPGGLLGVRTTGDCLALEPLEPDQLVEPATLGQRLAAELAARPDEPMELDIAVCTACADDPALFRDPLPPLGDAVPAVGLHLDGHWLATAGFDVPAWRTKKRTAAIATRYELSEAEAHAVLAAVSFVEQIAQVFDAADTGGGELALPTDSASVLPAEGAPTMRAALDLLAEPAVAEAVWLESAFPVAPDSPALVLFAESVEPLLARSARPAMRWLRAKGYERTGDVAAAETSLHEAEALDPGWPLTLYDLARYASDRGDAARALALLRRAGAPADDPFVESLSRFQAVPRTDIGRNQPCWCGSGRKYKQCHLRNEQLPLAERAAWLYQKACQLLEYWPWRFAVDEAAQERARYAEDPDALLDAYDDPLVADAVLFEGGAFAEFLALRGDLLPADERSLAEQWLLAQRSVFEVVAVRAGAELTLRDLRTGNVHEVRERTASRLLKEGMLICARVVPAGDTTQIFGGLEPVAAHERDALIELLDSEPDPLEVIAFLTRSFAHRVL